MREGYLLNAMPFRLEHFQEHVKRLLTGSVREALLYACEEYRVITALRKKTDALRNMMVLLDNGVTEQTRWELMESCGRQCIGGTVLKSALKLAEQAKDLDDLLVRLNEAHIGGGLLRRKGDVVHAEYHRCYCGSVSKTKTAFSPSYCYCSCGWYKQLFETILERPARVELLSSIIQGDDACRFKIHLR